MIPSPAIVPWTELEMPEAIRAIRKMPAAPMSKSGTTPQYAALISATFAEVWNPPAAAGSLPRIAPKAGVAPC